MLFSSSWVDSFCRTPPCSVFFDCGLPRNQGSETRPLALSNIVKTSCLRFKQWWSEKWTSVCFFGASSMDITATRFRTQAFLHKLSSRPFACHFSVAISHMQTSYENCKRRHHSCLRQVAPIVQTKSLRAAGVARSCFCIEFVVCELCPERPPRVACLDTCKMV